VVDKASVAGADLGSGVVTTDSFGNEIGGEIMSSEEGTLTIVIPLLLELGVEAWEDVIVRSSGLLL